MKAFRQPCRASTHHLHACLHPFCSTRSSIAIYRRHSDNEEVYSAVDKSAHVDGSSTKVIEQEQIQEVCTELDGRCTPTKIVGLILRYSSLLKDIRRVTSKHGARKVLQDPYKGRDFGSSEIRSLKNVDPFALAYAGGQLELQLSCPILRG